MKIKRCHIPQQFKHIVSSNILRGLVNEIRNEVREAEAKFPMWPNDIDQGVMIMIEEAGESVKAALQYTWERGELEEVRKELIQTAAMCFRAISHIDKTG